MLSKANSNTTFLALMTVIIVFAPAAFARPAPFPGVESISIDAPAVRGDENGSKGTIGLICVDSEGTEFRFAEGAPSGQNARFNACVHKVVEARKTTSVSDPTPSNVIRGFNALSEEFNSWQ